MKKKVVLLLVFMLLFSSLMTGCSPPASQPEENTTKEVNNEQEAPKEEPKDPDFLSIGTASLGGNFFPMGAAIGVVIESTIPKLKVTAQATGGSSYNMNAIQNGELNIALAQGTAVAAGVFGTDDFKDNATDSVRTIANYHATPQHILVRVDANVSSIDDLKGLKFEVIAAGDGVEVSTKKILGSLGLSEDDVKYEYSGNRVQAASRLKTGQVDAIIDGTGVGAAWLVDVIGKGKFKLISLTDEQISKIADKYKEFSKVKIPAGSYEGQTEDVYTISNWTVIVCSDNLSEELIYKITKNLMDNTKFLTKRHNYFTDLKPENIVGGIIAPLHPGAEKYYKEIGVLK